MTYSTSDCIDVSHTEATMKENMVPPSVSEEEPATSTTMMNADAKVSTTRASPPTYRMVALDLDGTLLQSDHQIADDQVNYLRELHSKGFTICIATGRAAPSVYEHVQKLNLPVPIPVVCSNGACGFLCHSSSSEIKEEEDESSTENRTPDEQQQQQPPLKNRYHLEKEDLFYDPVPMDVVQRSIQICKEYGYAVQYYHKDTIYANQKNDFHYTLTNMYTELTGSAINHVDDEFESLIKDDKLPSKLLILFDDTQCTRAFDLFSSEFSSGNNGSGTTASKACIVGGHFNWFLEVLHPEVTKGHGLSKMCKALNIPLEECIAIGDGSNDYEFLEMAGLGIAMNNAKDKLKEIANEVMEWNNDQHGVMKTLKKLDRQGSLSFHSTDSDRSK